MSRQRTFARGTTKATRSKSSIHAISSGGAFADEVASRLVNAGLRVSDYPRPTERSHDGEFYCSESGDSVVIEWAFTPFERECLAEDLFIDWWNHEKDAWPSKTEAKKAYLKNVAPREIEFDEQSRTAGELVEVYELLQSLGYSVRGREGRLLLVTRGTE